MQAKGGFAVPRLSHGAELFAWGGEHKHAVKCPDRIKRSKASERLWLHSTSQRNAFFFEARFLRARQRSQDSKLNRNAL